MLNLYKARLWLFSTVLTISFAVHIDAHDVNKIVYEWKDGRLFIHDELAAVVIEDIELLKETHKYVSGK